MVSIPGDPGGQRSILVILIHGREIAPFCIVPQDFRDSRFKIDAEHQPDQKKSASARWRVRAFPTRDAIRAGAKNKLMNLCFEQHSVRLVAREILRGADKGKKSDEADDQRAAGDKCSASAARTQSFQRCKPPIVRDCSPTTKTRWVRTRNATFLELSQTSLKIRSCAGENSMRGPMSPRI